MFPGLCSLLLFHEAEVRYVKQVVLGLKDLLFDLFWCLAHAQPHTSMVARAFQLAMLAMFRGGRCWKNLRMLAITSRFDCLASSPSTSIVHYIHGSSGHFPDVLQTMTQMTSVNEKPRRYRRIASKSSWKTGITWKTRPWSEGYPLTPWTGSRMNNIEYMQLVYIYIRIYIYIEMACFW